MGVVPPGIEKASECVFHGPGCARVNVAFHGRKVNHVFAEESIRVFLVPREDPVQHPHCGFGLVVDPADVFRPEIVQDPNAVLLENVQVLIESFTLMRVGDHGFVLDTNDVPVSCIPERQYYPFELPGCGVCPGRESATKYCP